MHLINLSLILLLSQSAAGQGARREGSYAETGDARLMKQGDKLRRNLNQIKIKYGSSEPKLAHLASKAGRNVRKISRRVGKHVGNQAEKALRKVRKIGQKLSSASDSEPAVLDPGLNEQGLDSSDLESEAPVKKQSRLLKLKNKLKWGKKSDVEETFPSSEAGPSTAEYGSDDELSSGSDDELSIGSDDYQDETTPKKKGKLRQIAKHSHKVLKNAGKRSHKVLKNAGKKVNSTTRSAVKKAGRMIKPKATDAPTS